MKFRHPNQRHGVAGILASIIFFAMLFTAGLSLIVFTMTQYNSYDKAQATAQQAAQSKSAESLSMRSCDLSANTLPSANPYSSLAPCGNPPVSGTHAGVWIQNAGGVPVTLVGIYIIDTTSGVTTEAPSTPPSPQTTPTLSYTLNVGNTKVVDTGLSLSSTDKSSITLITSTGNEFTTSYPPSAVSNLVPSISTTLSQQVIPPGGSVYDTSALSGVTASAGGTVKYYTYSNGACSAGQTLDNTVGVTNTVVPASTAVTFNSAGPFSWNAVYSGDANNAAASSNCEPFTVGLVGPSITTTLSSVVITPTSSVFDTAVLSGGTSNAGGTVTYSWFSGGTCTGAATVVGSAVTVTNGIVPNSASQPFNAAGSFSWHAVYSGDSNNVPATSACEPLTVTSSSVSSLITTTLSAIVLSPGNSVYDSATLSQVTGTAGGTVTYRYFSSGACAGSGSPVSIVTVTNAVVPNSAVTTFAVAGNYSWQATYSGDTNNGAAVSACEPLTVADFTATCTNVVTKGCVAPVAEGLGYVSLDFNSYKYYSPGSCSMGGNIDSGVPVAPTTSCSLTPTTVAAASVAYTINPSGAQYDGAKTIYSANMTNADPNHRVITLDAWTQIWFSSFNLKSGGGTAQSYADGLVNVANNNGIPTKPLTTLATTPSITIPWGQSATVFFGINQGGDPNQASSNEVTPVFILFHGTVGGQSFAEDVPFATTIWTSSNSPALTAVLSATSTTPGGSVYDSATLSGATVTAGGTVTYYYFSGNTCIGTATQVGTPVTVLLGIVPNSSSQTFNTLGQYSWDAVYGGDSNNLPTESACEPLTVAPSLTLNPTQGVAGVTTTLSGTAYTANTVYSDCLSSSSSAIGCVTGSISSFTATGAGAIPAGTTVTVPAGTASGTYYVMAYSGTSIISYATFTVTTPAIILNPTSGQIGTSMTVTGSGYSATKTIGTMTFNGATPATQTCTAQTTSATGTFSCTFTVPSSAKGSYSVVVAGSDAGTLPADSAASTFTLQTGLDPNAASSGISGSGVPTTTSRTITISTSNTNDLIYACENTVNTGLTLTISDTSALTWTARGAVTGATSGEMKCWYSISAAKLTGDAVTVTSSANSGGITGYVFAVSGVKTSSPFDPNLGAAVTNSGTGTTASVTPFATTNANDVIVGVVGLEGTSQTPTVGSSYTMSRSINTAPSGGLEYILVTTTGTQSPSFTQASDKWVMIADAIDPVASNATASGPATNAASHSAFANSNTSRF